MDDADAVVGTRAFDYDYGKELVERFRSGDYNPAEATVRDCIHAMEFADGYKLTDYMAGAESPAGAELIATTRWTIAAADAQRAGAEPPPWPLPASELAGDGSAAPAQVGIASLDEFADADEEADEALLGDADNALIPEGADVMLYGDGGAGKTTLAIDLACHLAAGDDWLGIPVSRPARVLIIENEGPRPRFRRKLRQKRDAWPGSPLGDRIDVLERPWGAFSFDAAAWRELLAARVLDLETDVIIVGPVTSAGMDAAGTLQEVRAFMALVAEVRAGSGRRLVVVLIHHENKGGQVSGAWEGAGDTLLHVQAQGHGRIRLYVQKARWASEYHATTLTLRWAGGDGFEVEEKDELDDEAVAELLLAAAEADPGTTWGKVEKATPGVGRDRRMAVRDGLFAAGRIVNVSKEGGVAVALAYCPERKTAHLFAADDPTIRHLLPARGADEEQTAPPGGERATSSAPRPVRPEGAGEQEQTVPPAPDPAPDLWDDAGKAGREETP